MTKEQVQNRVDALNPWYHKIELPFGIVTPGEPYDRVWENIRKARQFVDYKGKRVLDTASFDGMWAFDAERLGASMVIATDCNWLAFPNFMFCREVLKSQVLPLYNVPMHELVSRLDSYLLGHNVQYKSPERWDNNDPRFDVVHHMGLLYHLRDPLQSLLQVRSVMKDGGTLLIESGCCAYSQEPVMVFNAVAENERIYVDPTTWWAPTVPCLIEMLAASLFAVRKETVCVTKSGYKFERVALVATAVPIDQAKPRLMTELQNTYRCPGLRLWKS